MYTLFEDAWVVKLIWTCAVPMYAKGDTVSPYFLYLSIPLSLSKIKIKKLSSLAC